MKRNDVDRYLNSLKNMDENFFKNIGDEIQSLQPEIEADPSIDVIKEIIGEVPSQIAYLKERVIEVKKKIQDLKLLVKAKRTSLEIEKSKIRQGNLEKYQNEHKQYMQDAKKWVNDLNDGKKKISNQVQLEILKNMKPEKPTQSNLDDLANLTTEKLQKEILMIEKKINEYDELHGMLDTLAEKYENKKFSAFGHRALKEAEIRSRMD